MRKCVAVRSDSGSPRSMIRSQSWDCCPSHGVHPNCSTHIRLDIVHPMCDCAHIRNPHRVFSFRDRGSKNIRARTQTTRQRRYDDFFTVRPTKRTLCALNVCLCVFYTCGVCFGSARFDRPRVSHYIIYHTTVTVSRACVFCSKDAKTRFSPPMNYGTRSAFCCASRRFTCADVVNTDEKTHHSRHELGTSTDTGRQTGCS